MMELWSMPNIGVLVATGVLHNEEALLEYRMSNLKQRRMIYTPMYEEDQRRWSSVYVD